MDVMSSASVSGCQFPEERTRWAQVLCNLTAGNWWGAENIRRGMETGQK